MIKVITLNPNRADAGVYVTPPSAAMRRFSAAAAIDLGISNHAAKPWPGVVESAWFDDLEAALDAHGACDLDSFLNDPEIVRYVARENVVIDLEEPRAGEGWVKLFSFINHREDLSVSQFLDHWRNVHAPLVRKAEGVLRYVQSLLLPEHYIVAERPDCDGVAELWWRSAEDYRASWAKPERAAESADVKRFCSDVRPYIFLAEEFEIRS